MAEPVARHMVVSDLDDQLRLERLPFAAAFRAPAAGPAGGLAGETRPRLQRAKLSGQRLPLVIGDCRGEADVIQEAFRVVETEQLGSHLVAAAQISKASDHTVGGPQALDLDHRALAAEIFSVQPLGDDPVPPVMAEIIKPFRRLREIARARRDDELARNRGFLAKGFERASPLGERQSLYWRAIRPNQHVEKDQSRRRFLRQLSDPAGGRMQPGLQRVKGQTPVQLDDQFAVDDKSLEWEGQQRR